VERRTRSVRPPARGGDRAPRRPGPTTRGRTCALVNGPGVARTPIRRQPVGSP